MCFVSLRRVSLRSLGWLLCHNPSTLLSSFSSRERAHSSYQVSGSNRNPEKVREHCCLGLGLRDPSASPSLAPLLSWNYSHPVLCCCSSWVAFLTSPLSSRHSPLCSPPSSGTGKHSTVAVSACADHACGRLWLWLLAPEDSPDIQPVPHCLCSPCSQLLPPLTDIKTHRASLCAFPQFSKCVLNVPRVPAPALGAGFHSTHDCHSLPCGLVFWEVCKESHLARWSHLAC